MRKNAVFFIFFLAFLLPFTASASAVRQSVSKTSIPNIQQATEPGSVLRGKTIVVDPGHGGSDPGSIGSSGLAEKEVTLAISLELGKLLRGKNAEAVLTRTNDRDVANYQISDAQELQARVNVANKLRADLFVSVHVDSFSDKSARGTTTYFYPKTKHDERVAVLIQQSMVEQLGLLDRGTKENNFYVLKHSKMPAVLAEVAFISNPVEETLLNRSDFIQKAAYGIYTGIMKFFELSSSGS